MKDNFKHLIYAIKIGGAIIVSVIVLTLLTMPYKYTPSHIMNPNGTTDFKWESGAIASTMEEGFSWLKLDDNGFNNIDTVDSLGVNILLMGSSHMEGFNVKQVENVCHLLNQQMNDRKAYNIGISGHNIYRCIQNLKNVAIEYKNADTYIIETDTVKLDVNDMELVMSGTYPRRSVESNSIEYKISRYLPISKRLISKINEWRIASGIWQKNETSNNSEILDERYTEVINDFMSYAQKSATGKRVIIVYHPIVSIDSEGEIDSKIDNNFKAFSDACSNNGIEFIDMTDDFQRLYEDDYSLAHGFINTAVGAGHLNANGHRLIAERLLKTILQERE